MVGIKRQPQALKGFSDNLPLSLSGERILLKRLGLFILHHRKGCLPIEKEKNKQIGGAELLECTAVVLIQHLLNIRFPIQSLTSQLNMCNFACRSVVL